MGRWSRKRKAKEKAEKAAKHKKGNSPNKKREGVYHFNVSKNIRMQVYYALQGLHDFKREEGGGVGFVPCTTPEQKENERQLFMSYLRTILPASFRVGIDSHPLFRKKFILEMEEHAGQPLQIQIAKNKIPLLYSVNNDADKTPSPGTHDDTEEYITKTVPPVQTIPYVPHAYQLCIDRRTIRKNPSLTAFHDWIKIKTDAGFVTRQETVSMIPPVVLDAKPHHKILDMCAAPGSKTCQLLEIVSSTSDTEPRGYVVANDSDAKRAYMLVHQLRRMNSPAAFVTSVDARFYPGSEIFDRVLADVPCSGDGTVRKNPGIWRFWNHNNSLSLHRLQLSIAVRGAGLLKRGGTMVYSTCAMNPIENEAVVAELLRQCPDLKLIDVRPKMKEMAARPGMSHWKVFAGEKRDKNHEKKNNAKMQKRRREWEEKKKVKSEEGEDAEKSKEDINGSNGENEKMDTDECNNDAEEAEGTDKVKEEKAPENGKEDDFPSSWDPETLLAHANKLGLTLFDKYEDVPEITRSRIRPSCFPPTPNEISQMKLDRCMRVLPHDMDTGAFFVAAFRKDDGKKGKKKKDKKKKMKEEAVNDEETSANDKDKDEKGDNDDADDIKPPPRNNKGGDAGNSDFMPTPPDIFEPLIPFYGLSPKFPKKQIMVRACGENKILYFLTKSITTDLIDDQELQKHVTVINSGVKLLQRNSDHCEVNYRVNQEGIHLLVPYMTKRVITATMEDFEKCLVIGENIKIDSFTNKEYSAKMQEMSPGSFVVALEGCEKDWKKKMMLVMWRCRSDTVNCMVGKVEMEGMRSKLKAIRDSGNDDSMDESK